MRQAVWTVLIAEGTGASSRAHRRAIHALRQRTLSPRMTLSIDSFDAPDAVVVLTSVATADAAATLVRALLERHLVACGTILPAARSLYRWEGEVADEAEVLVLLKTRRERVSALKRAFDELHPYDVPELLSLAVEDGSRAYLAWLGAETAVPVGAAPRGD